jgi:DNA polymerase III subunit epsilon
MSLLARWWGRHDEKDGSAARRWIVLDVETTGLDMAEDQLLAVAAVGVQVDGADGAAPRIVLEDSFEAVLLRESTVTDKDNILVHGIGVGAQRSGRPPREVLEAFERWVGDAPLLAFHAAFDQTMIGRAMKQHLARTLRNRWLDLAPVAAALHPDVSAKALDDWLDHFAIDCAVRHQAAADTLATAELLLRLWPAARANRCASWAGLQELTRQQRWLAPQH